MEGARSAAARTRSSSLHTWLFSTDNVRVGVMWIAATLLFFYLGGIAALLIRSELAFPGQTLLDAEQYSQYFTLHGTMMVFFFAVPVFFGLGSILVPGMIGTRNLAFPRLNSFDFWLVLVGGLVLEVGFLFGERPMSGWTSYTPLSLGEFSPGRGQDWWVWGIFIETVGGTLAGINFLVTILRDRRPGLKLRRMPLFVWAMLFTSILTVVAGPILLTALAFMFLDRNVGTAFFDPSGATGAILWQDLFWFYSHPATYVMAIPAFGVVSMILPRFSSRPILSYGAIVLATGAVTALGFLVWWHHMLVTGMHLGPRVFGAVASWAIAIPSGVLIFTWLFGLRRGRIRLTTPMLFALGWLVMFTLGGANGLFMAYVPLDTYVHDTYWLVAHLHYIIFSATVFGIFAGIYYWFPSALGITLNETLGKLHFWGAFLGMNMTFFPMHLLGLAGMPRRVHDYDATLAPINFLIAAGMFLTAAAMALFLANLAVSLRNRERLADDPWGPKDEWNLSGGALGGGEA